MMFNSFHPLWIAPETFAIPLPSAMLSDFYSWLSTVPFITQFNSRGLAMIEDIYLYRAYIEIILIFVSAFMLFLRLGRIRTTRPFLRTFALILIFYFIARLSNFDMVARILEICFLVMTLGFMILFQPELRRLVIASGSGPENLLGKTQWGQQNKLEKSVILNELYEAIRLLSKTRTGALIVLESNEAESTAYLEIGTPIGAKLSSELLLTIFHPNTPLHDGALIINPNGEIVSAGVLLPLSENSKLSWEYGTRHRAAVGLSEISPSTCFIISEETGRVSRTRHGEITRLADNEAVKAALIEAIGADEATKEMGKIGIIKKPTFLSDIFSGDILHRFFPKKKQANSGKSKSPNSVRKTG